MKIFDLNVNNPQGVYDSSKSIGYQLQMDKNLFCDDMNNQPRYSETISSSCISGTAQPIPTQTVPRTKTAYICRLKTGEQIRITSDSFRIGKDPHNCEYCVKDNSAISRCHVLIKQINGKWFITDLNSTNKTYVNERVVYPNMDIELYNGINIRLANEDFTFNL